MSLHMCFFEELPVTLMKPLTVWSRAYKNIFLKSSMVSHPPYHPNKVSDNSQPNKNN